MVCTIFGMFNIITGSLSASYVHLAETIVTSFKLLAKQCGGVWARILVSAGAKIMVFEDLRQVSSGVRNSMLSE